MQNFEIKITVIILFHFLGQNSKYSLFLKGDHLSMVFLTVSLLAEKDDSFDNGAMLNVVTSEIVFHFSKHVGVQ